MRRTRIKICGIASVDDARAAVEAGADAIGLVFAPGSPRRVTIDLASAVVRVLPPFVTAVGVFQLPAKGIDPEFEQWRTISPWSQLHGEENEQAAMRVARGRRLIKGFRYSAASVRQWSATPHVEMLLIDGPKAGSGKPWDRRPLAAMMPEIAKPVMLAGGLDPANVAEAIQMIRPYAVDVSSGVESAPGKKNAALIHEFCEAVRKADATLVR